MDDSKEIDKIKVILLNNGMFASVDERDYEAISQLGNWKYDEEDGTAYTEIDGERVYMHDVVYSMHKDELDEPKNDDESITIDGFSRKIDAALVYDAMARFLGKDKEELNFPVELPIPNWLVIKAYETLVEAGIEVDEDQYEYELSLSQEPIE